MSKLSKDEVLKVVILGRIGLAKEMLERFTGELQEVIAYVRQLDKVDTSKIEPTSQVTGLSNVFREDKARPSIPSDKALSNAPSEHNGFFKVKPVLEE